MANDWCILASIICTNVLLMAFCLFQIIQHNYPLHRISYCADDKSDKRMLTFIAKESESNKHQCFVFDSEKCVCVQEWGLQVQISH